MHGIEVSYYKKLFQTVENIMLFIEKDDIPQYLLFLEDVFPYMEKYHYQKGMKKIIQELQHFIKANTYGTASDRALLLDYQATLEPKTDKIRKRSTCSNKRNHKRKCPPGFQPPFQSWRALPNQRTT